MKLLTDKLFSLSVNEEKAMQIALAKYKRSFVKIYINI